MERPEIPLDWCTTGEARESLDLESPRFRVTWTTPENPFGDDTLAVLDTRAFGTVGALLEARRKRLSCPVLVLCAPEEVAELVGALEVTDDITLHEAPSSLLVFQIHRLVLGSYGRDRLTGLADRAAFIDSHNTRSEDWAARYGGEEISVVMHGTPLETARPVLERIRSAVAGEPFTTTDGKTIEVTVSGGAAERRDGESLEELLERVSRNLLSAKQGGRNRIVS